MKLQTIEESGKNHDRPEIEKVEIELAIEIKKKLDHVPPSHSIFGVPNSLRKHQVDAFIPNVVSIGPYHRNENHLQGMETHKWRLLRHVLERTKCPLKDFTDAMFELEENTRKSYDKPFENLEHQEFVEMMLLDACFILELLNVAANGIKNCRYNFNEPLFSKWGMPPYMQHDLLMLENQLPLFVLNRLFPLICGSRIMLKDMDFSVEQLALQFFDSVLPGISQNLPESKSNEPPRLHLLDVVHHALRQSSTNMSSKSNFKDIKPQLGFLDLAQPPSSKWTSSQANLEDVLDLAQRPKSSKWTSSGANWEDKQPFQAVAHSVTTLRGASVKFRKKDSTNFTNIEFNQGVLSIPPLVIHEFTKSIFLNLMVFEQYSPHCSSNYVTSYVRFMDRLINSAKDVELLRDKGVIVHELSSNVNVVSLFNDLRKYIVNNNNDSNLAKVSQDLNEHFNLHVMPGVLTLWDCKIQIDKIPDDHPQQGGIFIFEVPNRIRSLQPDAFIPHVVSIGPYHRDEKRLQEMEKHKQRLYWHVLAKENIQHKELKHAMCKLEGKTRGSYSMLSKNFDGQNFVNMMLLDACFILGFLKGYHSNDPVLTRRGILSFIKRDLLVLDNQLPHFVINELFHFNRSQSLMTDSVEKLALDFFDLVLPNQNETINDQQPCLHLLGVVSQALKPSSSAQTNQEDKKPRCHLPEVVEKILHSLCRCMLFQVTCREKQLFQRRKHSVTRLRGNSVVFKRKESPKFTDIEFNEGVLSIPPLEIHDSTKAIFLNLMLFEQYHPRLGNHATSYVIFMAGLINSAKDVEHLCEKGIIKHDLGNDEDVAKLFNNLRKDIVFNSNDSYLAKISEDLNKTFNTKWSAWKATLRREYLKDPWKVISIGAASFLIFLTLAQTTYAILGYHRPRF